MSVGCRLDTVIASNGHATKYQVWFTLFYLNTLCSNAFAHLGSLILKELCSKFKTTKHVHLFILTQNVFSVLQKQRNWPCCSNTFAYTLSDTHTHIFTHTHKHTYIHPYIHAHAHTPTHTCTHTHTGQTHTIIPVCVCTWLCKQTPERVWVQFLFSTGMNAGRFQHTVNIWCSTCRVKGGWGQAFLSLIQTKCRQDSAADICTDAQKM